MLMRPLVSIRNGLTVLALALAAGCNLNSGTPSAEDISNYGISEFLVENQNVEGIYINYDVNAVVFRYETTSDGFWQSLDKVLAETDWELVEDGDRIRRFQRPSKDGHFRSIEEARVALEENSRRIVVAFVQADFSESESESESEMTFEESGEASYARDVVWPKFVAQLEAQST